MRSPRPRRPGRRPLPCRGRGQEEGPLLGRDVRGSRAARHRAGRHLGADRRPRRRPGPQGDVLRRRRLGRRLEDDELGDHLRAGLRLPGLLLHRLRRARPDEHPRRLGRGRREQQPAERRLRRRRLPLSRRREDVGERRAEGLGAHREDPRPPEGREDGLRRGAGAALGRRRRPRPLQDDGRREDVEGRPDDLRQDRRQRRLDGSAEPRRPLRGGLPAPPARLHADQRRAGERPPQVDRRRCDLDEADERPPEGGRRPDRPRDSADGARHGLRPRRGARQGRRLLPLARRRDELGEARRVLDRRRRSTTRSSSPTRRTPTASTRWTPTCR